MRNLSDKDPMTHSHPLTRDSVDTGRQHHLQTTKRESEVLRRTNSPSNQSGSSSNVRGVTLSKEQRSKSDYSSKPLNKSLLAQDLKQKAQVKERLKRELVEEFKANVWHTAEEGSKGTQNQSRYEKVLSQQRAQTQRLQN